MPSLPHVRYKILPIGLLNASLVPASPKSGKKVFQTSMETVAKNAAGTEFVVKYDVADPPTGLGAYTEYDHAGILVELAKSEWIKTNP